MSWYFFKPDLFCLGHRTMRRIRLDIDWKSTRQLHDLLWNTLCRLPSIHHHTSLVCVPSGVWYNEFNFHPLWQCPWSLSTRNATLSVLLPAWTWWMLWQFDSCEIHRTWLYRDVTVSFRHVDLRFGFVSWNSTTHGKVNLDIILGWTYTFTCSHSSIVWTRRLVVSRP